MRILLVDDDPIVQLVLRTAVERLGHRCDVVADGMAAWQSIQTSEYQVVISDWMMPEMDGIELCQHLRERTDSYTYFIMLTAHNEREHMLQAIQPGADDYLAKPLDVEELQLRLLVAERISRMQQQLTSQQQELARLNRELFEQGRRDPLTQVGNRLRLREDLESLPGRFERYGQIYCALLCDIDNFKMYNDHYGHLAGDEALLIVSSTFLDQLRQGDAVYRYGGEEFLLILPEQSLITARMVAERLRQTVLDLALPHARNPPTNLVTISIGIAALQPNQPTTIQTWLHAADMALYRAKNSGRNRVVLAEAEATV